MLGCYITPTNLPDGRLAILVQTCFKSLVLVACKAFTSHYLQHNVPHPHAKVLVPVPAAHAHVEAPDEPVLDKSATLFVQDCVDIGGVKSSRFKRAMSFFSSCTLRRLRL